MGTMLEILTALFLMLGLATSQRPAGVLLSHAKLLCESVFQSKEGRFCCTCPAGNYVYKTCKPHNEGGPTSVECRSCPPQTYTDRRNGYSKCNESLKDCQKFMNAQFLEGNETINSRCICKDGYYSATGSSDLSKGCHLISPCLPGFQSSQLANKTHNTHCEACLNGTFSNVSSPVEKCIPWKTCSPDEIEQIGNATDDTKCFPVYAVPTNVTPAATATEAAGISTGGIVGIILCVIILALAIGFAIYRQRRKRPSPTTYPDVLYQSPDQDTVQSGLEPERNGHPGGTSRETPNRVNCQNGRGAPTSEPAEGENDEAHLVSLVVNENLENQDRAPIENSQTQNVPPADSGSSCCITTEDSKTENGVWHVGAQNGKGSTQCSSICDPMSIDEGTEEIKNEACLDGAQNKSGNTQSDMLLTDPPPDMTIFLQSELHGIEQKGCDDCNLGQAMKNKKIAENMLNELIKHDDTGTDDLLPLLRDLKISSRDIDDLKKENAGSREAEIRQKLVSHAIRKIGSELTPIMILRHKFEFNSMRECAFDEFLRCV